MLKKLIVGNWKMNPQSKKEAETLFKDLNKGISSVKNTEIVICPPHPFIFLYNKKNFRKFTVGAQDISIHTSGSHTGEVTAGMLGSMGAGYVIVGHSERRAGGETNQIVNQKIINILKSKITPILCIGESSRDEYGEYLNFIKDQLHQCLSGVSKANLSNVVIAYEPIWAIGADAKREATVEEFVEIKIFIRKILSDMYDAKTAHNMKVLYGGSVNPNNSGDFMHKGGADGLLIGRDSLVPKNFILILKSI